jgi:8-oxo-dGTP pyrophosphatase MutT (NUDIX family)
MATAADDPKRPAAVVIPIFADAGRDVLFVRRARHLRRHAGQIAFPGGAVDATDADHAAAALRELHEEVGIPPERVRLIGELTPVRQTRNVFMVTPFVGIVAAGTPLIVDRNEADGVLRIPLAEIVRPDALRQGVHHDGDREIETFILDHDGARVWGLTATILNDFVTRYQAPGSPLRDALDGALEA